MTTTLVCGHRNLNVCFYLYSHFSCWLIKHVWLCSVFSLTYKTIVGDNQCQAYNWDFISLNNIRRRLWEERHPDWQHFLFRGTLGMYLHACYLRNSARSRAPKHFRHLVAQPNTVRQRWLAIIYTSEHLTHWFHSRDCQKPEASVNSSFLTRKLRKCGESEKRKVIDRERIHSMCWNCTNSYYDCLKELQIYYLSLTILIK